MGYPNNLCMHITVYVHHMQLDELFDFYKSEIKDHNQLNAQVKIFMLGMIEFNKIHSNCKFGSYFTLCYNFCIYLIHIQT